MVFPFLYIYTVCIHSLTTVPIIMSVWNFGFGSGLGVNSFEVGRFIPVYMFRSLAYGYLAAVVCS